MEPQPITLKPERMAELTDYAKRHGKDAATALDAALADYFAWERQDYAEAVEGIRAGYEDMQAGRTQDASEMFDELCVKHGLSR